VSPTTTEPRQTKSSAPPPRATATQPDYAETLEKLADLRKKGVITEEEFTARKKELLDKMTDSG